MTQSQVNRAVARQTGETLTTIRRHGFSIADPDTTGFDPEPVLRVVAPDDDEPHDRLDWDELQRFELPRRYHRRQALAAA